jgi:hypothetical protein
LVLVGVAPIIKGSDRTHELAATSTTNPYRIASFGVARDG